MSFTHQELCSLAVNWLQRAPSRSGPACQVAFSEAKRGWNGEIPAAIGFRTAAEDEGSVVVEVKVSRADYLADRGKAHRQVAALGMGLYRYYFAPEGIISPFELPAGWGLVEVSAKSVLRVLAGHVTVKRAEQGEWRHERAIEREWLLLASMLSRLGNVEAMHSELKKAKNERAELARQLDAIRERERANMLSRAVADIDSSQPLIARRKVAQGAKKHSPLTSIVHEKSVQASQYEISCIYASYIQQIPGRLLSNPPASRGASSSLAQDY